MGLEPGLEAHHLIPIEALKKLEVVQAAVTAGFDINGVLNGIAASRNTHLVGHREWNIMVMDALRNWAERHPGYTNQEARQYIEHELIPHLANEFKAMNEFTS